MDMGSHACGSRAFVPGEGRGFSIKGRSRADGRFTLSHRLGRGTFLVRVNS
jgi:hypothetical protein